MRAHRFFPWRRWLGRRATAAVEFAIVAPVLLLLLVGTSEMLMLYRTEAKLNELTSNFAQMVSLQNLSTQNPLTGVTTGTAGTLGDLCKGAIYGLQPFPPNGLTIAVASLTVATAAQAATKTAPAQAATYDYWEADSSCANTAPAIGYSTANPNSICQIAVNGPSSMLINQYDNAIVVRATLTYPGIVGLVIGSAPTLTQTAVARWRYASSLATPPELTCATGADCLVKKPVSC